MASTQVNLQKGAWTQITITSNDGSIRHQAGGLVVYVESELQPAGFNPTTPTMSETNAGDVFPYYTVKSGESVYAYAVNSDAVISVTHGGQYASR